MGKGEHIIRKGEVGKYFYIIRTGNVSIQDEGLIGRKLLGTYSLDHVHPEDRASQAGTTVRVTRR